MSSLKKDRGSIQKAIQMLAGTHDKDMLNFELATVTDVDTANWQCTAQLVSSTKQTEYTNVQLTSEVASNGFVQVPKVGSNVILAITWRNQVYVFMCSEVDALVFHQANDDDGSTFEEFVICCNSDLNLPMGIQLTDGGGNGIVINSGGAKNISNSQGDNGIVISNGTADVSNDSNGIVITNSDSPPSNSSDSILMSAKDGIVITNSSSPPSNSSSGLLITCSGTMQLNDGSYGGMVKLLDQTDPTAGVLARLNDIENFLTSFVNEYNAHTHLIPVYSAPTGTPAPTPATTSLVTDPVPSTTQKMLENADITHGAKVS